MVSHVVLSRRVGLLLVVVSSAVLIAQVIAADDGAGRVKSLRGGRTTAPLAQKPPGWELRAHSPAQLAQAVQNVLAYTPFVARGGGKRRQVALTFDDGPGPYTPKILATLNRLNARATFFFIGSQERTFHNATIAQIRRGHAVGDHTENHARLPLLPAQAQHDELFVPIQWLARYGLPRPLVFRPPYGMFNQSTLEEAARLGLLMVMWSVDSRDYIRPGVQKIVDRVMNGVRPGAIVLLHDGGGDRSQTVKAIPKIIGRLRARHYHLVTVPELMRSDPPPHGRPLPQLRSEGG